MSLVIYCVNFLGVNNITKISKQRAFEVSHIQVKFIIHDGYKTVCPADSEVDFQLMSHIYHNFNNNAIDFIVDVVGEMVDILLGSLLPS